jgi:hypothetical protein
MLDNYKKIYLSISISSLLYAKNLIFIWIVLTKTNSILLAGVALTLLYIPGFLSFIIGPIVDSITNKKNILIISDAMHIVIVLFIIIDLLKSGFITYIIFFLLLFLYGFTSNFSNVSFMSLQKHIVNSNDSKKYFKNLHSVYIISSIFGLLLTGILLTLNYNFALIFMAFILIISTVLASLIDVKNIIFETRKFSFKILRNTIEAFNYLKNNMVLSDLQLLSIINGFGIAMIVPAIAYISHNILGISAFLMTTFFIAGLIGSFTGTLISSKIHTNIKGRIYKYYLIIAFIFPFVYYSVYIFYNYLYIIYIIFFITGLMESIISLFHSLLNFKYIDKKMSASVYGLKQTLNNITQPFSGVLIGFIITFYFLRSAFLFIFIIFFIDFIILLFLKGIRNVKI